MEQGHKESTDRQALYNSEALPDTTETGNLPSVEHFAKCQISGTRQRLSLPNAAVGKIKHSAKAILPSA